MTHQPQSANSFSHGKFSVTERQHNAPTRIGVGVAVQISSFWFTELNEINGAKTKTIFLVLF